jgi:hypothetical protein
MSEGAKPDYLDFDKDGNEKESMKKALKDKKKGGKCPKCGKDPCECDKKMEEGKSNATNFLSTAYRAVYGEVENVEELYKGKHGQTEKQYQDSRSDAGKMISGDSKGSGANYSYRAKNTGSNPAGGSEKPQGQARMGSKDRAYLKMQKANLKKEEVDQIDEADSLAAMQARREKRLAAQRKREGTNDKGKDFGHDYVAKRRESNMKKEEVSFSETELKKFEEIVNSWTD